MTAVGHRDTDIHTAERKSTVCSGIFSDTSKPYTYLFVQKMLTIYLTVRLELDYLPLFEALVRMHRAAPDQRRYAIMPFCSMNVNSAMMPAQCDLPSEA